MASSAEEMRKHIKIYIGIFIALLFLTVVTVAVSFLHMSIGWAVVVALIVASIKGSLVALYFMHLVSERLMIWSMMALGAIFFFALLLLPTLTEHNHPHTRFIDSVSGQSSGI